MPIKIEEINQFSKKENDYLILCEIRKDKKLYSFPVEINFNSGEIKKIDYPSYKKHKSILKLDYKKDILKGNESKFLKVIPADRIEKYKFKAKPTYSFRINNNKIDENNLLTLREKLGHNNGILVKGSLLGTSIETNILMSIPIYIDMSDSGKIKASQNTLNNPLVAKMLLDLSAAGVILISKENQPIKHISLNEKETSPLQISAKDFISLGLMVEKITNIKFLKDSQKDSQKDSIWYKYQPPMREHLSKYVDDIAGINNIFDTYVSKHKELEPSDLIILKNKVQNIIDLSSPGDHQHTLFYALRRAQKKTIHICEPLFKKDDDFWNTDSQREKIHTPREELFRNFILWTMLYARGDLKEGVSFIDKDYISLPSSFLHIQDLPISLPRGDFKINTSFLLTRKIGSTLLSLNKLPKEVVSDIEDVLVRIFKTDSTFLEHEFDPVTDKYPYAKILLSGTPKNNKKEYKKEYLGSEVSAQLENLLIEELYTEDKTTIRSEMREEEEEEIPSIGSSLK